MGASLVDVIAAERSGVVGKITVGEVVGLAGGTPLKGPAFTYTDGVLTRIDYDGGEYKTFTYTDGVLTQLDLVKGGVTYRKTFNYTSGVLTSIDETEF